MNEEQFKNLVRVAIENTYMVGRMHAPPSPWSEADKAYIDRMVDLIVKNAKTLKQ